jgi:hypothetical protein
MNLIDVLGVIGMFLLRVGVPLAITVGVVYLLKRLDRRWEAEAKAESSWLGAEQRAGKAAEQPTVPSPAERPATPKRAPSPELPFIPPPPAPDRRIQPGLVAAPVGQPCWNVKGCSPNKLEKCAAPRQPDMPCWQARFDAEGQIPEECVGCDIFQHYPVM